MARRVLLPDLHAPQHAIVHHPARFKVIAAGRRFGKGVMSIGEAFRLAYSGARAWWVTPSFASASFSAGWRMAEWYSGKIPNCTERIQAKSFEFVHSSGFVQFKTAEEPDSLRGEGIDFVIIDEAAHIPKLQEIWELCLRPALADRKGSAWFISTPRGFNFFEELFRRGRDDGKEWASFQYPSVSNPYLDPSEIEAARKHLPSLIARQEFDAEFVQLAGALFKREWFTIIPVAPEIRYVRSWDLAFTEKTSSDYTAGAKVGMDGSGRIIIAHMVRGRWEWPEAVKIVTQTAKLDGAGIRQGVEVVGAQVGFLQTLQRDPALSSLALERIEVTKDKLTRALPLLARAEQGKVCIVEGTWNRDFLDEICSFSPDQKGHDDQVDAVDAGLKMIEGGTLSARQSEQHSNEQISFIPSVARSRFNF